MSDDRGQIVSANQLADQLFGYATGHLIGRSIEQLVPETVSQYHEKLRESFNLNPLVREMGYNRDLFASGKMAPCFQSRSV